MAPSGWTASQDRANTGPPACSLPAHCGSELGAPDVLVATEKQGCRGAPDPVRARALSEGGRLLLDAWSGHGEVVTATHPIGAIWARAPTWPLDGECGSRPLGGGDTVGPGACTRRQQRAASRSRMKAAVADVVRVGQVEIAGVLRAVRVRYERRRGPAGSGACVTPAGVTRSLRLLFVVAKRSHQPAMADERSPSNPITPIRGPRLSGHASAAWWATKIARLQDWVEPPPQQASRCARLQKSGGRRVDRGREWPRHRDGSQIAAVGPTLRSWPAAPVRPGRALAGVCRGVSCGC
jgi:hypothetical protein